MAQILLVEPDAVLAKTYASYLSEHGHHVLQAGDAQSAIHACDAVRPDCIVLEIQLPRHNGIEFLYEFRSHADWQDIPIILLTGLDLERIELDESKMRELGIASYSYKPDTSLTTLNALVEDAVRAGVSGE